MASYWEAMTNISVSQDDIDFFSALPLAASYLSASSHYQPIPFITRYKLYKDDTSDTFFSQTIKTNDTIPRMLALMRKHDLGPRRRKETRDPPAVHPSQCASNPYFMVFAQLGSGINGFRDTLHGGVVAALFDEALALCVEGYRASVSSEKSWLYTATLEVAYRSPVATPSVVLIKTWVENHEGRKWILRAQLLDLNATVKAEAKSLYISSKTDAWL